jgi:hypothetical protein
MKRLLALIAVAASGAAFSVSMAAPVAGAIPAASSNAWCRGAVSWQAARASSGELPVRVKAKVVSSVFASSSSGRPTFLNLGRNHPSPSRLTVVIWGRDRVNFPRAPERMFRAGTMVCVQGFVSRYRGVTQIEVALYDAQDRILSF